KNLNNIREAFRNLEKKVTICDIERNQAIHPSGFIFHTNLRDPFFQIPIFLLDTLDEVSINRVWMMFSENNKQEFYQVLAEGISRYQHRINDLTGLTNEELKGIAPYLTSIVTYINNWSTNKKDTFNFHINLINNCSNLNKIKTDNHQIL